MKSNRVALVAMLVAAEIFILGLAFYVVGGGRSMAFTHGMMHSGSMQHPSFTAHAVAPIAAGSHPVVYIDDANSGMTVSVSSDNLVHVEDRTSFGGAFWGKKPNIPQLAVSHDGNGVRIVRAAYEDNFFSIGFSNSREHIDIQAPAGAVLEIVRCSGATITGVEGGVNAVSQDGSLHLFNVRGTIVAHSNDGRIELRHAQAQSTELSSGDGRIVIDDVTTPSLVAKTADGRITATGLMMMGASPHATIHSNDGYVSLVGSFAENGSYDISTDDGHIDVALDAASNATVNASTNDGSIALDGHSSGDDSANNRTLRVGNGSGAMRISTHDGNIHITTNGAS